MRICVLVLLFSMLPLGAQSNRLKILCIGDSLSKEYAYEVTFSAPVNSATANTRNWAELLTGLRSNFLNFGSTGSHADLRVRGYEYNFSVPGHTAAKWAEILSNPKTLADNLTRFNLSAYVRENSVHSVVIFLGGNDLDNDYGAISQNVNPPATLATIKNNIFLIYDSIRSLNSSIPIVVCTVPDVGATYEVSQTTTAEQKTTSRARTAALNAEIISTAAAKGAAVARIDALTTRIYDEVPFNLNGTGMIFPPNPQNENHHLFCRDGFHPATAAQALIANEILKALNPAAGTAIPLFTTREILSQILSFNPDEPYLLWAGASGGPLENPDGDGFANLADYLLGGSPVIADMPFMFSSDGSLAFKPDPAALRYAALTVEESITLQASEWSPLPASRLQIDIDGRWHISPSPHARTFYRLAVEPRP